jgi:nucleotide-binding universal stress UspA family protein/CBS domain-containing protein
LLLTGQDISGVPVVDAEGRCVGVLSAIDFVRLGDRRDDGESQVRSHMTADPVTAGPDTSIADLAQMMIDAHIHRIIVVDERGKPIGIVSSTNVLAAVIYRSPGMNKGASMLPIRCILHPTDFSKPSEYAFRLACSLARDHGGQLLVLHIVEPQVAVYGDVMVPQPNAVLLKEAREKLLEVKGPAQIVGVSHRVEVGLPAEQILRVAKESQCDMIVMGTHGRRGLSRLLVGSVAEQVTRQSLCPVVIVKTPILEAVPAPSVPEQECVQI